VHRQKESNNEINTQQSNANKRYLNSFYGGVGIPTLLEHRTLKRTEEAIYDRHNTGDETCSDPMRAALCLKNWEVDTCSAQDYCTGSERRRSAKSALPGHYPRPLTLKPNTQATSSWKLAAKGPGLYVVFSLL
jgi:hypothetical protein